MTITLGSTVDRLKRGGKKSKEMVQQTKINIHIGDKGKKSSKKSKKLPPAAPSYRVISNHAPMPGSIFYPNQPKLISPGKMQFENAPRVLTGNPYGGNVSPFPDHQGNNPIRNGSDAYTAGAPNAANQNQAASAPAMHQVSDQYGMPATKIVRFQPTMDRNAPRNMNILAGNIPEIASATGTWSKQETTGKEKPIMPTSHLHNVAAIAAARNAGQNPLAARVAAEAAPSKGWLSNIFTNQEEELERIHQEHRVDLHKKMAAEEYAQSLQERTPTRVVSTRSEGDKYVVSSSPAPGAKGRGLEIEMQKHGGVRSKYHGVF